MNNLKPLKKDITEEDFVFFNKKEISSQDSFLWDLIGISLSIIFIAVFCFVLSESYDSWSFHYNLPFFHYSLS